MATRNRPQTLILGGGITGRSVLRHLTPTDAVVLVDSRSAVVEQLSAEFPGQLIRHVETAAAMTEMLIRPEHGFDRAVVSPGLADDHPLLSAVIEAGLPRLSDLDLFAAAVAAAPAPAPIIGCTGTNGKSTVTTLLGALLEGQGFRVGVGGNLGPPALDLLPETTGEQRQADFYVLELSSFQLERSDSLPLELAMFLNFAPDHLDYHRSEAAYFSAKQRIFKGASQYLCNREDERSWPLGVQDPATVISFGFDQPRGLGTGLELDLDGRELIIARARDGLELRLPASGFPLAGRHNLANLLAALAALVALQPQPDLQRLRASVDGFAGLPHRCERVGASGGVEFINDSKATNVAATVAAIEGLAPEVDGRVLLLVGGDAKDAELAALRAAVADRVALVICYGADGPRFAAALADTAAVQPVDTAAAAFAAAVAEARSGDLVLLAPAAASFDEFANFAARGDWFREQVARHVGRQEAQPC